MPVHWCSFDDLENTVAEIETSTERIVSVVAANDSTCAIVTYLHDRAKPKGVERR